MKSLWRITPSLLMVTMLTVLQMPAAAQTIRPPNAVDDAEITDPGATVTIRVLANDSDPQGNALKVIAVGTPAHGTATFNDSTVIYTPAAGFTEIDVFTYVISNGALTDTAFVDAIVLPPPDTIWENDIFDPLALGSLSGQNGWTTVPGNNSPAVITDPDPNRGKTVQIDAAPGQTISVTKDVPDQTSGRHGFSFFVKAAGTAHLPCEAAIEIQTDPGTGWSNKARFCIGPSITINYNSSGAETTIVALAVPGQWYFIHGEMNLNTNLLDVWVDGQLKVSGILVHPGPILSLGITGQDQGGAGAVVVDDLTGATANGASVSGPGGGTGTPGIPVYWINAAGGLWSDAANWNTQKVPTATDHAIITLSGNYIVTIDRNETVNSLTLGAGFGTQILRIKGNGRAGSVTLTVNNDIPNSGVIHMESETAGYASNLTIVNGLLMNQRVIEAAVGSGGPRVITGRVLNRCRVDAKHDLTFNGTFTNRAQLKIAAAKLMSLNGGAQVFNQNGGEIGGNGVLVLSGDATMNFSRGATTGAAPILTNAKLNFGPAASGVATLIMQGQGSTSQLSGDIGAEQTVWIRGNGQPGSAIVTALNSFTNAGIIRLESQVSGYQSNLTVANGILTNTGAINANQGSGGPRAISGTLVNRGEFNANFNATFSGTFSNHGTLTIDSLRTMSFPGSAEVFNQNAGTIAGDGVLTLFDGATMNFNNGMITGAAPILTNAKLNFGPSATGVAAFIMQGQGSTSQLSGDIGAEQTVWIRGNGQPGNAIITAQSSFTNAGVIRLESRVSGYQSNLTIANGILTNTGAINANQGSGGPRAISGTLVNRGEFNANFNATFNGTFSNHGTLTIDSLRTMSFPGNTEVFNQNAGTIAGDGVLTLFDGATMNFNSGATTGAAPILTNAKLNFGPSATGVAAFIMQGQGSTSQLSGDIGAEQTVWIRGNGQPGNAVVTAQNGFTNAGVIRLESQVAGYQSNLTIANGILTNTGTINVNQGSSGPRVISGTVLNHGQVDVNHDFSIDGDFTTNGILGIGLGPTNNEFDQLQVSGAASLDSTLNLNVPPGFDPPLNTTYQIVTCNSCSGVFSTVNGRDLGNGKHFRVIYNPTNVTLQVVPEEAIAGLTAINNSPTPLDSATTFRAVITAGSNVSYSWDFGDGTAGSGAVVTHTYATAGNYTAIVTATNSLNSVADTTAVNVFIVPIAGLTATNNSPTRLDSATTLTAMVTAGSRVNYTWNFGDGTTGNGAVINHTYPAVGVYTAVVTATNAVSTLTDTTTVTVIPPTKVEEPQNGTPTSFMLSQNYPNPFNPSTTIRYAIPKAGHVTLKVYNLLGKEIATLVSEKQAAGEHEMRWHPVGLMSGVYVYRLQAGEFVATQKLVLLQ